jgi:hypothetical protein
MISIKSIFEQQEFTVGRHNDVPDDQFPADELARGIEVEKEHTDSEIIAKAIAKDHLAECSTYYTRLDKMEKECENQQ